MSGPREAGELGIMAIRGGDVIGEHTAFFWHRRAAGADAQGAESRCLCTGAHCRRRAGWWVSRPASTAWKTCWGCINRSDESAQQLHGNLTGLSASDKQLLERIYRRRVAPSEVVSEELGAFWASARRR